MNISGTTPSLIMWFNGGKTPIKQLEINNVTFTSEKTFSDHKLYKYNSRYLHLHFYWTCCSIFNVCLNKSIIRLWSDEMCWSNADLQAGGAASILVPQTISAASALDLDLQRENPAAAAPAWTSPWAPETPRDRTSVCADETPADTSHTDHDRLQTHHTHP